MSITYRRKARGRSQYGIGLIEVLIALFVAAIGVLALTRMHGTFMQSTAENKARSEAIAIAQSRIEDMRNYMHTVTSEDEFNTLYANTTAGNSATVNGINAVFTRQETIGTAGDMKTVAVTVAWTDPDGSAQSVSLDTELSYLPPGGAGLLGLTPRDPLIVSPTGRARLGDGTLPDGATTNDNGDGTAYYNPGADLKLVVGSKIVLTLEDACRSDGTLCTDFVKIKGRIYIDESGTNVAPGEVYVHASDASYCTRYFIDEFGDTQVVAPETTAAATTANSDYSYYDYTCYLGGGWHGNVGILMAGGVSQQDKICQGDPVSSYSWEAPVIALRRAYRGMIYAIDGSGNAITNASGDVIYYTQGIGDAVELPKPGTGDHGHDFVVTSMSASNLDGSYCESLGVMLRTDSDINGQAGDRWAGNPGDFVCLNSPDASYIDAYDPTTHAAATTCPYDPTDPPIERHEVRGTLRILGDTPDDDSTVAAINIYTSDGAGNCLLGSYSHNGTNYVANYACDAYDWGSGWTGFVTVEDTGGEDRIACAPSSISKSGLTADSNSNDFNCILGNRTRISGSVTTSNSTKVLTGATMSDGNCVVAANGLSYLCISNVFETDSWSGSVSFTSDAYLCSAAGSTSGGSLTLGGGSGGGTAIATGISGVNSLPLTIENNSNGCPAL